MRDRQKKFPAKIRQPYFKRKNDANVIAFYCIATQSASVNDGNGLSQDPNSPKSNPYEYDPYVGATLHVNNNLRDVAGIVKKGTDIAVTALTTKIWGTNSTDDPNWRPVVRLKGSRYISLIEETPGVYAITLVN